MFQYLGVEGYSRNVSASSFNNDKPKCSSADEITKSVMSADEDQTQCVIPWLSVSSVCQVFNSYSHVIWNGDSLTRHTVMALHLYMRENYFNGGFPELAASHLLERCNCDGQFSENKICRIFDVRDYSMTPRSKSKAFCGGRLSKDFVFHHWIPDFKVAFRELCSDNIDPQKLRFVYLQGGAWQMSDPTTWFNEIVRPAVEALLKLVRECSNPIGGKIRLVLSGISACDQLKTARYPHQNRSAVFAFMPTVKQLLNEAYPTITQSLPAPVVMLDFAQMTARAIDDKRTSEGCHFMSDVNLIKFMTLTNIMRVMAAPVQ